MGKKKKQKFISKKNAHKFTLVHRSQRDPLQADDDAGQHVLMPIKEQATPNQETNREDNIKHGIFFDDNYDYMQHLRPRGEGMLVYADEQMDETSKNKEPILIGNVELPSEVFASNKEDSVGMLNKAVLPKGPQPDWDPDVAAALDDGMDFDDPDNFLEDDFMLHANAKKQEGEYSKGILPDTENYIDEDEDGEWVTDSDESDVSSQNLFSDDEYNGFDQEDNKSRFTDYSMTSSIIRRTEGLKVLDDRFERIMEEYDEDEIGCVDHEEVQGALQTNSELLNVFVEDFLESKKTYNLEETKDEGIDPDVDGGVSSDTEDEDEIFAQFKKEPKEQWDCESILSTYSNIYNHPKLIMEKPTQIKYELHKRTGVPIGVLHESTKADGNKKEEIQDDSEAIFVNNSRNKNETPEEKKQRKQTVKEHRKNRRMEKKANKVAFKNEFQKQEKISSNSIHSGIKL